MVSARSARVVAIFLGVAGAVLAGPVAAKGPDDYEALLRYKSEGYVFDERPWVEVEASLPPAPQDANLLPIVVSQQTDNRFFVDEASVHFGSDDVIRYTMVVISPSGVRNVSFEGMRCKTAERRLYAFGRSDGSWAKARNGTWQRIEGAKANRQHAALFSDYFCSIGSSVGDTEGARRVLRYGNPAAIAR